MGVGGGVVRRDEVVCGWGLLGGGLIWLAESARLREN